MFDSFAPRFAAPDVVGVVKNECGGDAGTDSRDDGSHPEAAADEKEVETATKQVTKIHGEWDRKLREYHGMVQRSSQCSMTQASQLETRFKALIESTKKIDSRLLILDSKIKARGCVQNQDIAGAKKDCIDVVANMKSLNKIMASLKTIVEL